MDRPHVNDDWHALFGDEAPPPVARASGPIDDRLPLKVYALPGCSACLRTKEFLRQHGVAFIEVNPQVDKLAFDELAAIGVKRVPIVARGKHWADGQVMRDVARIAGIATEPTKQLPPDALARRAERVMSATSELVSRIPAHALGLCLPGRPRSYKQLACHIFHIYEIFLELVEHGRRLEFAAYFRDVPPQVVTPRDAAEFGESVLARFRSWWNRDGRLANFGAHADVYYGDQTPQSMHDFLERTVWHSAQHARQLQVVVESMGLSADGGLTAADLAGLPLPDDAYDDNVKLG